MMAVLILIVLVLAIVHFVYEGIILPTIRLYLRYHLFALRDGLRWLKFEDSKDIEPDSYKYLQETLNVMIAFLHRFNIWAAVEAKRYFQKYPDLQAKAELRIVTLDNCKNQEFQKIRKDSLVISCWALVFNSAGFFCWLCIPLVVYIIAKGLNRIWESIMNRAMKIFCIPERESDILNQLCM